MVCNMETFVFANGQKILGDYDRSLDKPSVYQRLASTDQINRTGLLPAAVAGKSYSN